MNAQIVVEEGRVGRRSFMTISRIRSSKVRTGLVPHAAISLDRYGSSRFTGHRAERRFYWTGHALSMGSAASANPDRLNVASVPRPAAAKDMREIIWELDRTAFTTAIPMRALSSAEKFPAAAFLAPSVMKT